MLRAIAYMSSLVYLELCAQLTDTKNFIKENAALGNGCALTARNLNNLLATNFLNEHLYYLSGICQIF